MGCVLKKSSRREREREREREDYDPLRQRAPPAEYKTYKNKDTELRGLEGSVLFCEVKRKKLTI